MGSIFDVLVGGKGIKTRCGAILTVLGAVCEAVPVLQPWAVVVRTVGEVFCGWGLAGGVVATQLKK